MFALSRDIQFFFWKVLIVINCVLLLYIKVIRSCLRSQIIWYKTFDWCFISFVLVSSLIDEAKISMTSYFLWRKCLLLEKPSVLYCFVFDEPQLNQLSSNVPDFLQVNSSWYNLKTVVAVFLTVPTVLTIFRIRFKPAYSFFLFVKIYQRQKQSSRRVL